MKRPGGVRAVALTVALAPVFTVLSVVVNTPPAGALTADQRQALASEIFNDDCSRANPPDECQQQVPGNDDCLRANPPDECQFSGPGALQAMKFCFFAILAPPGLPTGPVCLVVMQNTGPTPVKGIVLKDVLQPSTVTFADFFAVLPPPEETLPPVIGQPCPIKGNTARCNVGTLQPGQMIAFVSLLNCPEIVAGGTNTATITARNAPRQTLSAQLPCGSPA